MAEILQELFKDVDDGDGYLTPEELIRLEAKLNVTSLIMYFLEVAPLMVKLPTEWSNEMQKYSFLYRKSQVKML